MKEQFYNISIDNINTDEALKCISNYLNSTKNNLVFFLNAHCFNLSRKNADYRNALNNSTLVFNDGIGIKIASKIFGIKLKENMNGTDLIPKIMMLGAEKGNNIFLLGSKLGVAENAKKNIEEQIPGIKIVGVHHGYFKGETETDTVIQKIINAKTDILIVGMGVPMQELFLTRYYDALTNVKVSIAGGAIIDFQSGIITRAPQWIRKLNIEWLYRFYLEPKRMFNRYFSGGIIFIFQILWIKFFNKIKE